MDICLPLASIDRADEKKKETVSACSFLRVACGSGVFAVIPGVDWFWPQGGNFCKGICEEFQGQSLASRLCSRARSLISAASGWNLSRSILFSRSSRRKEVPHPVEGACPAATCQREVRAARRT
eukprot:6205845-Pleurochrysis_carterae.AAC.1